MVIFCYPAVKLNSHEVRGKTKAGKVVISDKGLYFASKKQLISLQTLQE